MSTSGTFDITDVSGAATMDSGRAFSPAVLGLAVVAFLIGVALMWATMSSVNANKLVTMQEEDAAALKAAVTPKVQNFTELHDKIMALNETQPNPEAAEALAATDFAVPGAVLATVRVPLSGGVTDTVSQYAADTQMLKSLLDEHRRLTTKVDKEELEQLLSGEEAIKNNPAFGVLFDVKDVVKNADKDGYEPKAGTLVGVRGLDEKEKKYDVEYLGSGNLGKVEPSNLILLEKSQILKSGGQNALTRYTQRVRMLKYHADRINKYAPHLVTQLDRAVGGEEGAAAAPAAEEPAAEAPAE